MFHISCSIDKIVDAADLPKYPESVKAHPVVKGVDGALWSIQNLLSDINEMEYSDHSLNTCIEYWIDCINRCNHSWSAAIGLLPSSQTESLILFRSSIESALAISVPYHLKDERWESGNFTKFFFKFEDNKGDTTINSLWTKEIDKYSLVSTPVPKKHWIQIIRLLHKATHTIPNKLDKGDEMWGFHRTRDLINDFVEDEGPDSWLNVMHSTRFDILRYSLSMMFAHLWRVVHLESDGYAESKSSSNQEVIENWATEILTIIHNAIIETPYEVGKDDITNFYRGRIVAIVSCSGADLKMKSEPNEMLLNTASVFPELRILISDEYGTK